MTTIDPALVAERVDAHRALIDQYATRPVSLVAVTKRFGPEAAAAAMDAGILDIGESYSHELLAKSTVLADRVPHPRWHFIGHVQRNKVRSVADVVHLWQSVDSPRLGREIAKRVPGASVLVQVNMTNSQAQSGVPHGQAPQLVDELRNAGLDVRGLMMIGAIGDPELTQQLFSRLRTMADELELCECSMGMSGDLEAALTEGSTMIRVGTGLFGPRPSV